MRNLMNYLLCAPIADKVQFSRRAELETYYPLPVTTKAPTAGVPHQVQEPPFYYDMQFVDDVDDFIYRTSEC